MTILFSVHIAEINDPKVSVHCDQKHTLSFRVNHQVNQHLSLVDTFMVLTCPHCQKSCQCKISAWWSCAVPVSASSQILQNFSYPQYSTIQDIPDFTEQLLKR